MPPADVPAPSQQGRALNNLGGLAMMALGMFLFAAVDATAKYLTQHLHPFQIVWTRQLGLVAGVVILLSLKGVAILKTEKPGLQILRGTVASGSAALFIFAVNYVPLADAVAVSFVAPFMVTLMGALILREPVGLRRWLAVTLGFVGTLIVIRPGSGVMHPAVFLVVLAAALFAVRQIIGRALAPTDRTSTTIAYTGIVSIAILSVPLPFVWQTPDMSLIWICVMMAAIAAAAEISVIRALEMALSVVAAPVQYTMIVWGTFYGFVLFGDLPDAWTLLGAAVIVGTGLYMLNRERLLALRGQP